MVEKSKRQGPGLRMDLDSLRVRKGNAFEVVWASGRTDGDNVQGVGKLKLSRAVTFK